MSTMKINKSSYSMDAEDCMHTNQYWTRLKMEWEPVSIDLDDESSVTPESSPSHKYYADYYDNYPYMTRSITDLSKSPYGIREFSKRISSGDRAPTFGEKRRRFYDNSGPTSLPIFQLSPEKLHSSEDTKREVSISPCFNPNSEDSDYKLVKKSTRDSSTSPCFDFNIDDNFNIDNNLNIYENFNIDDDYKCVEKICDYIDSIYESIDHFVTITKDELWPEIKNISTIEHSISISGLSFDDSSSSCKLEIVDLDDDDTIEKCDIIVQHHRVPASVHEYRSPKLKRSLPMQSLVFNEAESEGPDTASLDASEVKAFWKRLSENVPPPPIENKRMYASSRKSLEDSKITEVGFNAEGCKTMSDDVSPTVSFNCDSYRLWNNATESPLNEIIIECEDQGLADKSSDSSTGEYECFVVGASTVENSDCFVRNVGNISDENPTSGFNLSGEDSSVYLGASSINYLNSNKDTRWYTDKCQSLPVDINNGNSNLDKGAKLWTSTEPPENDLQKNSADRVLSEHQLRVQRSLQKLNLPDCSKESAVVQSAESPSSKRTDELELTCQFKFIRALEYLKMSKGETRVVSDKTCVNVHHVNDSSLEKLRYKNAPVPREGFLLKKRASDAGSNSGRGWPQQQAGLGGKTTSLGSLGAGIPTRQLALTPPSQYQQPGFTRWSTSRLNSAQTSPCSSARSSVRCGAVSPLNSPARPPRVPRPTRPPYLGWRSQERLASPRTPHERLAVSLLPASPPVPANTTEEIQTSIKEVTSAIVHYVSGLEPGKEARPSSPRGSPRLCWVESSFVGTKPLESPQTPVVVAQLSPPHQQQNNHSASNNTNGHANHAQQYSTHHNQHQQQRPLQLELHSTSHGNGRPGNTATLAATTYQHEWQTSQHSLLNLAVSKPSPGSTTLEDVLDSLLGLPPAAPRVPSPQTSPRRSTSPYYILGLQSRYNERSNSQTSSLQFSLSSKTDDRSTEYRTASRISGDTFDSLEPSQQDGDQQHLGRRRSSAESSSCSTLAPGTDGADKDENSSLISLPKIRLRAKSAAAGKHSSRRQSEPVASQKSVSLDRRVSYDSHISRGDLNLSRTSLSDLQQSKASLKSITSINTDASGDDPLVHCRYTKCTSATNHNDARRNYKNCHNCNYMYCSRECRRAHWEKHRKVCLHSRASALCRQILSTAKEDRDSLHHVSAIAQKGYSMNGRGVVKVFFTSPDSAEKFTTNGFQSLGEPAYVMWPDLVPNEMGPELYAELIKLCKSYNPETRLVLYVAVCIISEVPTKGAVVKWERQLVSRCAKLRLSKTVMGMTPHGQLSCHMSPKARVRNKDKQQKEKNVIYKAENIETLILTSNSANLHRGSDVSIQKIRELSFHNIQMQLHRRGVNLKRHFPEVYSKLCAYVEGVCDKFTPMTVYPRDNLTGKSFMCVIMPETEPDKFLTLPSDSLECHTIDVSVDRSDQVSTPM